MITDGNVIKEKVNTCKISLSSKDKDWLEDINSNLLDNEAFLRTRKKDSLYELWMYNSNIYDWLISHECVECKSLIVKMPNVPPDRLADFIRGCIDGDGSISSCFYTKKKRDKIYTYNQHVSYICSGSFSFLESLNNRLCELGINGSLCEVTKEATQLLNGKWIIPKNPHYRLTYSGKSAYNFVRFAYYPTSSIAMRRKKESANKLISFFEDKDG